MDFPIPDQALSVLLVAATVFIGLIFLLISRKNSHLKDDGMIKLEKKKRKPGFGWVLPVSVIAGVIYGIYSGDVAKWVNIGVWGGFLLSGAAAIIAKAYNSDPLSGDSQESIKRYGDKDSIA